MSRLDWPALLRTGLYELRLSPDAFWALTPAEFQMMLGNPDRGAVLSRGQLDHLIAAFPDVAQAKGDI